MAEYIYNDEDNAPMIEDPVLKYTTYSSRAEMKADERGEALPFTDPPEKHPNGCWNCINYNYTHEACTLNWNNMDEDYYNPEIDNRDYDDICDDWEEDEDAVRGDWVDGTDT